MRLPEVRPPLPRGLLPLRLTPFGNPLVVARQQHGGHVRRQQNGQTGAETSVVAKTDASTPWAGYTGLLKFTPAK